MTDRPRVAVVLIFALLAMTPVAQADDRYSAADRAFYHVLAPGCGDGLTWTCLSREYVYPVCFWNPNGDRPGFWDCNGYTGEAHYAQWHSCLWYVHIRSNAVFFWHDLCRGRYGTKALG